jgi:crotonobetainyl-CoA:carnitine CoA-transferase CaiB-like acyl-CoA transferase
MVSRADPTMYRPLIGLRVLDMGQLLPSALTAQKLQALGADVVKVEDQARPDWIRDLEPIWEGVSCQDQAVNRAKRSVALDLNAEHGRDTLLALISAADVVLENSLPGRWLRRGIDFAALRAARPELVVCSITGYGQTGPMAEVPSHGLNLEAMAGALPIEWNDGRPGRAYTFSSLAIEVGASHAAMAVCASLLAVRGGGDGSWIDISCWDAAVEAHRVEITMSEASGTTHKRGGRGAFYEVYECSDGHLVLLGAVEKRFWQRFCEGVSRPNLVEEWRGSGTLDFGEDRTDLKLELGEIFATAPSTTWVERFAEWGIPGSAVLDIGQIMAHPHYAARGFVQDGPGFPVVAIPIRWHEHDSYAAAPAGRSPACGEHTDEVLAEWLAGA